jgi:non-specific serine/threonine protein kinase
MLSAHSRYRFGTAEFDEVRQELKVAGLVVDLEPRVLALLAYLLRHAGELVTKDELLREVWAGRVTVEKVLPNAITKLRRALGEENAQRITTQARIGYRLDGPVHRETVDRRATGATSLAVAAAVPGRPNFVLQERLSANAGAEVWLAEHAKTRERRVYKFALDPEALRHLKRETTLLRVLADSLPDARGFVSLLDWDFESEPQVVEYAYGGEDLERWATARLGSLDEAARLELFLRIADAVAAAHSVGVLHKDIKPANILVDEGPDGLEVRLTDFGSGRMLDPERLRELGITAAGPTLALDLASDARSGTPLYLAPEVFAGQAPTVRSDVYALGVLLYQLLAGRLREPVAPGWEAGIDDPFLREDIRLATHRDPERRLGSAGELVGRLRGLALRRAEAQAEAAAAAAVASDREALARTRARRPFVIALVASLVVGLVLTAGFYRAAQDAKAVAEAELAKANLMLRFLEDDLISRSNPLVFGKGAEAPLKEVLLAARERMTRRFESEPLIGAPLHLSLAGLFGTLDLLTEAEVEAARALAIFERELGADSVEAGRARAVRARLLSRLSRFDEARAELDRLDALFPDPDDPQQRYLRAIAASTHHIASGSFGDAVPALRTAMEALAAWRPGLDTERDSLTLDLIAALGLSGEPASAVAEYERFATALAARPGDSRLLLALAGLGVARSMSLEGDHARAESLLLAAREVIAEQLGDEHTRLIGLQNELMGVHFRQGQWERAIPIAEDVHARVRARFGDAHNLTWVTLGNLGRARYEAGRAEPAVEALRAAHEGLARTVGADSPQCHDVRFVLAAAELSLGRAEAARALLDGLDPVLLEKARATGRWEAGIGLLRGLLARLDGDAEGARARLAEALEAHRDDPARATSRLLAEAERALAALQVSGPG